MKCLRCGYCCKNLSVAIVNDPEKGLTENNLDFHWGRGKKCKHLRGDKPGEYSCFLHDKPWYKDTPCFKHVQFERKDCNCRIGISVLDGTINRKRQIQTMPKGRVDENI